MKFIIPKEESKGYQSTKSLLINSGWKYTVEEFYLLKHGICFIALLVGICICITNQGLHRKRVIEDLQYGNNITSFSEIPSSEDIKKETELIYSVRKYMFELSMNSYNPDALPIIQAFIKGRYINYSDADAKRIWTKLQELESINDGIKDYLLIFAIAYILFWIPNYMAWIKLFLIDNKKDWETLGYMAVYSVMGRIPPYNLDNILENMKEIGEIYQRTIIEFEDVLKWQEKEEAEKILDKVTDDSMSEILETMVLASEIGVSETVANIDDLLENKMKWMDISAQKRRNIKSSVALVPVGVILFMLFGYLMYSLNMINQNMFIDI